MRLGIAERRASTTAARPAPSFASQAPIRVCAAARRPDRRGNLYPAKQRPEQKIDAAVALMMAVGRAMPGDDGQDLSFLSEPVIAA